MHYLGSKAKHADQILAHVLAGRRPGQWYVEPFVGGGNVLNKVPQAQGPRLASDYNPFMIALLKRLSEGWKPRLSITRPEYEALRDDYKNRKFRPDWSEDEMADVASIALGASFGSMWFGSWANDPEGEDGMRWKQGREACLRDVPGLRGANFVCASYQDLEKIAAEKGYPIPSRSLIYCDPPYWGTTGYAGAQQVLKEGGDPGQNEWKGIDFWRWADELVERGHTVFVSEYSGPRPETYTVPHSAEFDASVALGKRIETQIAEIEATRENPDGSPNYMFDEEVFGDLYRRKIEISTLQQSLDIGVTAARQRLVDRWHVVWKKAVTVNVASQKDTTSNQIELLLTRSPE